MEETTKKTVSIYADVTLSAFLLARITEDQAVAADVLKDAREDGEVPDPDGPEPYSSYTPHMTGLGVYANNADSSGNHIVALEPERAVAEFEAKRGIVEAELLRAVGPKSGYVDPEAWAAVRARTSTPVMWLLADPYVSHPDYPTEQAKQWRLT